MTDHVAYRPSAIYTAAFWGIFVVVMLCLWCRNAKLINAFIVAAVTCRLKEFLQQRREERMLRATHERVARAQARPDKSIQPTPPEIIAALPVATYNPKATVGADDAEEELCVICWSEYVPGEVMTVLPCNHNYHKTCINDWLQRQHRCPVCNGSLLPAEEGAEEAAGGEASSSHVISIPAQASEGEHRHSIAVGPSHASSAADAGTSQAAGAAAAAAAGAPIVSAAAVAASSAAAERSADAAQQGAAAHQQLAGTAAR
jgi:hypothetical protein